VHESTLLPTSGKAADLRGDMGYGNTLNPTPHPASGLSVMLQSLTILQGHTPPCSPGVGWFVKAARPFTRCPAFQQPQTACRVQASKDCTAHCGTPLTLISHAVLYTANNTAKTHPSN
jgi:hypothetical protein